MYPSFRVALLATSLIVLLPSTAWAGPDDVSASDDNKQQTEVIVTGVATEPSKSATGLALSPRETPQSITIVDQERIKDFQLTNVNDLLDQTVGINVERIETDRTYYNSRGFDITNFQVDGVGLPLVNNLQYGDLDTVLFDKVEAVRGANGLMTGIGNPSATINYVRKRPTDTLQANVNLQAGSWNRWRADADVSVPLTDTVAVRAIYAHEDRDSYLDYNHVVRNVYGIVARWNVTPRMTATVGYSRQENNSDGVLWGALPLLYSDGTRIDLPRSASTSAPWTYWDTTDQRAFAELAYDLGSGWQAKGVFTYVDLDQAAKLLYAYGNPDKTTGEGLAGLAGYYPSNNEQYIGDLVASGPLHLFGREHQLSLGFSTGTSHDREWQGSSSAVVAYPALADLGTVAPVEPAFHGTVKQTDLNDRLTRLYGAAHLNFTDQLKAVVGASATWLKTTGYNYGVDSYRKNSRVSPYAGLLYDLTGNITVYASYTDIFNPQNSVDVNNRRLDPATGSSIEGGIKTEWFDGRLYATASLFRAKQKNLAAAAGVFGNDGPGQPGATYYVGTDTQSRGFEIELAGKLTDKWTLSGGYTGLEIHDQNGDPARVHIPRRSLKLATSYAIPELRDLKLGAQLRWQSAIRSSGIDYRQGSYAVVDLMASMRLVDHVRASINVRNLTDTKYLTSLVWNSQGYYGAPRSVLGTISFSY